MHLHCGLPKDAPVKTIYFAFLRYLCLGMRAYDVNRRADVATWLWDSGHLVLEVYS